MKQSSNSKTYGEISIKKLPGSEIEITGSIPANIFDTYRAEALKNINESIEIDGFRKGNVPEKVLVTKIGEKTILEEMAEIALGHAYPAIIIDNKLDPIGRPEISITKIAPGNPLEFKLKTAISPEITLGDYRKIAQETPAKTTKEDGSVTDAEVTEAIERIKKSYADQNKDKVDENHKHSEHDHHDHKDHNHDHPHSMADKTELESPEFKTRIKEALFEDKQRTIREKRRIEIAENISKASTIELPFVLIESETRRIEAQFSEDIARMGSNLSDYLKEAKKSIEDLRSEWRPHAEKKVKLQLILNKIAETEKIIADAKEIEIEVNHILEHYKDADKEKATLYAAGVLTNEKVFQFLEEQENKKDK